MTCNIYLYKQIASRSSVCTWFTFLTNTDTLTIVNTCRYRYLNLLSGRSISGSTAGGTFVLNNLTCSVTVRTSLYITHHSKHGLLCIYDLTFTVTFRTGCRGSTWFRTCSVAGGTFVFQYDLQFLFTAKDSFFKSNIYACTKVCSLHRTIIGTSASATASK